MSITADLFLQLQAATASDEASVLFPEPPFWVTNAIVRISVSVSPALPRGQRSR